MSMTKAASEYFNQVAGSWDAIRSGYFGPEVRQAAIAKAYLRPEMVVADVGAGTGFISAGLAPLVSRVHAVDGSAAMLDTARKNLRRFDNVEFHEAEGTHLPFPSGSLDAVFANMYLHHTSDPLAAIAEMARVLRPGGRLIITDMDAHPYGWMKEEMADVWQGFERDQVRAWLREAGLVNVLVDCSGQSCCARSANPTVDPAGREAKISVFVATGARRMTMRAAVHDNYAALAQSRPACGCGSRAASQKSSCCGSSARVEESGCCGSSAVESESDTGERYYSHEELASAPEEASTFSLACGNPTAMAGLKPGEVVLDIGSGGGLDAFLAAHRVSPGGWVIGVDMTDEMLERARAAAERNGIANVEFRKGYAEEIPVEDASVDVILSNCVINLTEDKGRVFQEAFRVLKPGGRLEISDVVTGGPLPIELRMDALGWSDCATGGLPEQEYLDLIVQAGFATPNVQRLQGGDTLAGVDVYSAIISATKPAREVELGCSCPAG